MRHAIRRLLCAAALALVVVPSGPARAETPEVLAARLDAIAADAVAAATKLVAGNRAGAVADATSAADASADLVAALADAETRAGLGRSRAKFEKLARGADAKLRKASARMNDASVQPLTAQRTLAAAQSAALGAQTFLRRTIARGVLLEEVDARSAGFHDPQRSVQFRIRMGVDAQGAPCTEEPEIAVIDVSGAGAVQPGFVTVKKDAQGNRVIAVATGAAGGAGRVQVTACGVTRTWLLFNYGPRDAYPVLPKPEISRFDGAYSGSFAGTARVPGEPPEAVGGGVEFTVTNGVIRITEPGTGSGRLSASGKARFAGGGGAVAGARYSFGGTLVERVVGGVGGGGSWHATFPGGTASGSWSASRP